jgi:hypothetical protein
MGTVQKKVRPEKINVTNPKFYVYDSLSCAVSRTAVSSAP